MADQNAGDEKNQVEPDKSQDAPDSTKIKIWPTLEVEQGGSGGGQKSSGSDKGR